MKVKGIFKNILIKIIFVMFIQFSSASKNKNRNKLRQFTEDDQFQQGQVPPLISVLMNVPAYGRNDLYDWDSFIEENKKLMKEADKRRRDTAFNNYSQRLARIQKLQSSLAVGKTQNKDNKNKKTC